MATELAHQDRQDPTDRPHRIPSPAHGHVSELELLPGSPATPSSGWLRSSKLAFACFGVFLVLLVAQSLTGWRSYDSDRSDHGQPEVGYPAYLTSGHFVEATFENWESEFLQMGAFIVLTAFLVQRGSPQSKRGDGDDRQDEDPEQHRHDPDAPWPVRKGGVWLRLYENSLLLAFVVLFVVSIVGHALGGAAELSNEQEAHGQEAVSPLEFVRTSQFWFESFQNWQSEFLAVGSIVVLTVFLRQKGSPESKPVQAPNRATGD